MYTKYINNTTKTVTYGSYEAKKPFGLVVNKTKKTTGDIFSKKK